MNLIQLFLTIRKLLGKTWPRPNSEGTAKPEEFIYCREIYVQPVAALPPGWHNGSDFWIDVRSKCIISFDVNPLGYFLLEQLVCDPLNSIRFGGIEVTNGSHIGSNMGQFGAILGQLVWLLHQHPC